MQVQVLLPELRLARSYERRCGAGDVCGPVRKLAKRRSSEFCDRLWIRLPPAPLGRVPRASFRSHSSMVKRRSSLASNEEFRVRILVELLICQLSVARRLITREQRLSFEIRDSALSSSGCAGWARNPAKVEVQ